MNTINEFLDTINNLENREKFNQILNWINEKYPNLKVEIKWNQPMYTLNGTFIIGFSIAKNHLAFSPEQKTITKFSSQITDSGYLHTANIVKVKWNSKIDYDLLTKIINYNIEDKADSKTFFRKI